MTDFNDSVQGQYSQLRDPSLNPGQQSSIIRQYPIGTTQILPDAPAGFQWFFNCYYSTPAGASTFQLFAGADTVDGRTLAGGTLGGYQDGTFLDGGLCTAEAISVVVAGAPLRIAAQVALLPVGQVRGFYSQSLTDAYQVLALPPIAPGQALVEALGPSPGGWYGQWGHWAWNGNAAGILEATVEITRGSEVIELQCGQVDAKQRVYSGACQLPPLLSGDVVRAKTDVLPTGGYRMGWLFMYATQCGGF